MGHEQTTQLGSSVEDKCPKSSSRETGCELPKSVLSHFISPASLLYPVTTREQTQLQQKKDDISMLQTWICMSSSPIYGYVNLASCITPLRLFPILVGLGKTEKRFYSVVYSRCSIKGSSPDYLYRRCSLGMEKVVETLEGTIRNLLHGIVLP